MVLVTWFGLPWSWVLARFGLFIVITSFLFAVDFVPTRLFNIKGRAPSQVRPLLLVIFDLLPLVLVGFQPPRAVGI